MGINTSFINSQVQGAVEQFKLQLQSFLLVEIVTITEARGGKCTCVVNRDIDGVPITYPNVEILTPNGPYTWNLNNSVGILLVPRTSIPFISEPLETTPPAYSILGAKVIPVATFQVPTVRVGYSGTDYSIQADGVGLVFTGESCTISNGSSSVVYANDGSVTVYNGMTRIIFAVDGTVTREHVTEKDIPVWGTATAPDGTVTTTYYKDGASDRDSLEVAAARIQNIDGSSEFTIVGGDEDNPAWHILVDATGKLNLEMGENLSLAVDMETPTVDVTVKDVTVNIDGGSPVVTVAAKDVTLKLDGSGPAFNITDGSNTVDASSSGINIEDANGNKIAMGASGVDINGNFTVSS